MKGWFDGVMHVFEGAGISENKVGIRSITVFSVLIKLREAELSREEVPSI